MNQTATRKVKKLSTVEVIQTLNDGGALEELRDGISKVAKAVKDRGGNGSVTLTLKFSRSESGNALRVVDAVKVTEPAMKKDPTTFFALDNGELTRDNPSQPGFAIEDEE